jgi:hypothetical protein
MTDEEVVKALAAISEHTVEAYKATATPSWYQHWDLVQIALVGLIAYFIWSWKRILDKFEYSFEANQKEHADMVKDISFLEGRIEHHGVVCYGRRKQDSKIGLGSVAEET